MALKDWFGELMRKPAEEGKVAISTYEEQQRLLKQAEETTPVRYGPHTGPWNGRRNN